MSEEDTISGTETLDDCLRAITQLRAREDEIEQTIQRLSESSNFTSRSSSNPNLHERAGKDNLPPSQPSLSRKKSRVNFEEEGEGWQVCTMESFRKSSFDNLEDLHTPPSFPKELLPISAIELKSPSSQFITTLADVSKMLQMVMLNVGVSNEAGVLAEAQLRIKDLALAYAFASSESKRDVEGNLDVVAIPISYNAEIVSKLKEHRKNTAKAKPKTRPPYQQYQYGNVVKRNSSFNRNRSKSPSRATSNSEQSPSN
jgi:hypothetical protein